MILENMCFETLYCVCMSQNEVLQASMQHWYRRICFTHWSKHHIALTCYKGAFTSFHTPKTRSHMPSHAKKVTYAPSHVVTRQYDALSLTNCVDHWLGHSSINQWPRTSQLLTMDWSIDLMSVDQFHSTKLTYKLTDLPMVLGNMLTKRVGQSSFSTLIAT